MALLPTFSEVKASRSIQVASACANSDEFKSLVNEAANILLQRGDWSGTIVPIRVLARRGCVVWPRMVQRVRRINQCRVPIKVNTIWGDFIDKQDYIGWCGNTYWSDQSAAAARGMARNNFQPTLNSIGRVPIFDDIPASPQYIRCYCLCKADVGKTVKIYGADGNNQTLQTKNSDGTYTDGITLTLAIPYASSSTYVSRIDAVVKEVTQRDVPTYCYDPTANTLLQLAQYAPDETNPSYAKDRLFVGTNCNNDPVTVIALVKIAFIPVSSDNDFVAIPSLMAIKFAIQAIKAGESGDTAGYQSFMQLAVNELNMVLENESPLDQIPVDVGFGGGVAVGYQHVI